MKKLRMRKIPKRPLRDPAIETLVAEIRRRAHQSYNAMSQSAGISASTISKLDRGITRMPQHYTMARMWDSLGFDLKAVPRRSAEVIKLQRRA